ncbi:heparan-alpha-glucosaminide N-acetyltransferase domain-containing protein [Stigmatella sp. ncwal1]|uniref:Heparan-alpha-glucosaminide N-acetyltransferase domain-containing protein n=1 Tax=Stigmatella ashevillensis TaxID=2995309 RepID=A0ABT5DLJ7_9BACT|nr:acyltransferase family protein [Stigmatella ashevillena]MDC0714540.1 heparan-alpha-glucosaminide N-acetyltransferase domain-containing protein [Stigmatella ashevillena]
MRSLRSPALLLPPRHPALDGARGFAVMAMVMGHTLDALLAPVARSHPWVQKYWEFRGITAPLFLLVSGWAIVAALDARRPDAAKATYGRRVQRALLLLFFGYLLHWPGWETVLALGWGDTLLSHVFAFDALQCIGISLLLGATLLALVPGTWGRAAALTTLAVGIPLASTAAWEASPLLPSVLQQAVGGEGSHFPLFPWAGYFFAGALASGSLRPLRSGWPQGLALTVLGLGLLGITQLLPADWSPSSAWLVAFRVGQGFLVLAVMNFVPVWLSGLLAPLGRVSLWVYVIHLPVVYGWAGTPGLAQRVGPQLGLALALLAGVGLLAASFLLARLGQWLRGLTLPWRVGSTTLGVGPGAQRV